MVFSNLNNSMILSLGSYCNPDHLSKHKPLQQPLFLQHWRGKALSCRHSHDFSRSADKLGRLQAYLLTLLHFSNHQDSTPVPYQPPAWASAPLKEMHTRCRGILLHWQLDLHFLHLDQTSLFTAYCSALCPELLPPSSPFMYRYFIANTLAFYDRIFHALTHFPHPFCCHFYC